MVRPFVLIAVTAVAGFLPSMLAAQRCQMPRAHAMLSRQSGPQLSILSPAGKTIQEQEPNDNVASANMITLGDTVHGVMNHIADIDFFALDLQKGAQVDFDIDAMSIGSHLDTRLTLLASDGTTTATWGDGDIYTPDGTNDAHLRYHVAQSGRYYLRLEGLGGPGIPEPNGPEYFYSLKTSVFVAPHGGPGDPSTLVLDGNGAFLSYARKLVAGRDGDFYTIDAENNSFARVIHVAANGSFTTVLGGESAEPVGGLALDAAGNLLISACDRTTGPGVIWRVTPSGTKERFYTGLFTAGPIAIARDGDVWVWMGKDPGNETYQLWHFDRNGERKEVLPGVALESYDAVDMAFSPRGELYVASDKDIFKYVNGAPQHVMSGGGHLAFDKDGYLYVVHGYEPSRVSLLDPQDHVVQDTFALVGHHFLTENTWGIAFARSNSATTARLVVTHTGEKEGTFGTFTGQFRALNPGGIRAMGWPVGEQGASSQMQVTGRTLRSAVLGTAYADTLKATDAPGAVSWTLASGHVPAGVSLGTSGVVSGTPSETGAFTFDATASSGAASATGHFLLTVNQSPSVSVSITDVVNALTGGVHLSADQVQYLDSHGNRNGMLDVGDLRAFLRAQGQLAAHARP